MTVKVLAREVPLSEDLNNFDKASAVRLVNTATSPSQVIITDAAGDTIGSITLAVSESLTLQKSPEHKLTLASGSVSGVKVAHTN